MGIGLVYHNRKAIANRITPPPGNGCTKCLWGEVFVKVFILKRRHLVLIGYVLAAAAIASGVSSFCGRDSSPSSAPGFRESLGLA